MTGASLHIAILLLSLSGQKFDKKPKLRFEDTAIIKPLKKKKIFFLETIDEEDN